MIRSKHQWATFSKGKMKVKACTTCGELQLASNSGRQCPNNKVFESLLFRAGYRLNSSNAG